MILEAKRQTIELVSELAELARAAAFVNAFCAGLPASTGDVSALHLAAEELITNVITHGYGEGRRGPVTLTLESIVPDRVRLTVSDEADAYNPLANPAFDTGMPLEARPVGGLGIHLVRQLMDACVYERREERNVFGTERRLGKGSGSGITASIAATKLGSSAVLALSGRLDGLSSPELERQVLALIEGGVDRLEFDLSGLEYVGSAGLRVFLIAAKRVKTAFGQLRPEVREVFEVTGLLQVLDVTPGAGAKRPG
jgi:anti-anti-sigma factor